MKNKKPEKLVEHDVLKTSRYLSMSLDVVESKATFNKYANRYIKGNAIKGFSDIVGCDENGIAIFIELKAKGKLKTLKPHQRSFLYNKICSNAFAVVVDSGDLLIEYYEKWKTIDDKMLKAKYLLEVLP